MHNNETNALRGKVSSLLVAMLNKCLASKIENLMSLAEKYKKKQKKQKKIEQFNLRICKFLIKNIQILILEYFLKKSLDTFCL